MEICLRHRRQQCLQSGLGLPALLKAACGVALVAVVTAALEKVPQQDICSAAPKAAIEMLFRGVALQQRRHAIRANCVGPGFIDVALGRELISRPGLEGFAEGLRKSLPLKRFGEAQDVAVSGGWL